MLNITSSSNSSSFSIKQGPHCSNYSDEDDNALILYAIDFQDENALIQLLQHPSRALSLESVDAAFVLAVASQNIPLVNIFFNTSSCSSSSCKDAALRPKQSTVDDLFIEHAKAGTSPELIYILQHWSSPSTRAEQQRQHASLRKEYGLEAAGHYVISPSEEMLLLELPKDIARHNAVLRSAVRKANVTGDGKLKFHALLRYQLWMNDLLLDSVRQNRKLMLYRLLCLPFLIESYSSRSNSSNATISTGESCSAADLKSPPVLVLDSSGKRGGDETGDCPDNCPSGGSSIAEAAVVVLPSNSAIDEAFQIAIINGWLGTAEILVSYECRKLRADRRALNEALEYSIENCMVNNISWLLSGSSQNGGFLPDKEVINNLFEKYAIYPSLPQSMYPHYLRPRRSAGRRGERSRSAEHQQQLDLLCASWTDSMKLLQLHASDDVVDRVRKRRLGAARGTAQMRHRGNNDTDIHSFSRTTVNVQSPPAAAAAAAVSDGTGALSGTYAFGDSDNDDDDDDEHDEGEARARAGAGAGARAEAVKPARMTLNSAVEALIISRTESLPRLTLQDVNLRLVELIQRNFTGAERQEAAVNLLGQILNTRSAFIIGCTIQFLEQQSLSSPSGSSNTNSNNANNNTANSCNGSQFTQNIDIWLQGFLGESILVNSCNPGALERVVTGLRGVTDPDLNALFGQAEGPIFARNYISGHFNVFFDPISSNMEAQERATRNAKSIAEILLQHGVAVNTPWVRVEKVLTEYMCSEVSKYGVDIQTFMPEITCVVELLEDGYELYIKQYIIKHHQVLIAESTAARTGKEAVGTDQQHQQQQQQRAQYSTSAVLSSKEWQEFESYVEKYSPPEKPNRNGRGT